MTAQTQTEAKIKNDSLLRRKHPRRTFERSMGFLYQGKYRVVRALEVGEGGIAFISPVPVAELGMLVVSFQVPNGSFVMSRAEGRNSFPLKDGQFRIGCRFANIRFENKREIRAYVSARLE